MSSTLQRTGWVSTEVGESLVARHTVLTCFAAFAIATAIGQESNKGDWPTYGGNPGGQRFSALQSITPNNVHDLQVAWTFHTGSLETQSHAKRLQDFEATPILFAGKLLLTTPFDVVLALDPGTGKELWRYDPKLPVDLEAANFTSRGVATWSAQDLRAQSQPCGQRVYLATLDARLLSLDVQTGQPCPGFGSQGTVDLRAGMPAQPDGTHRFFGNTSPATVVGNTVVVGSAVPDNQHVAVEPGTIRGFDAQSGKLIWSFDPTPWANKQSVRTGGSNAWSVIAADPDRDMVFVPTGSPSTDFWGGTRPGDNRDANSVVALRASTGQKLWSFQLIHHDLWDYDTAAEPLLFDFRNPDGSTTPAVAAVSKVGVVFILDRLTGKPLVPVQERSVPSSDVNGNPAWPTQPFTSIALSRLRMDPHDLPGHSPDGLEECKAKLKPLRYDGVFTPPSLGGTLQYPGSLGGVNWSSMAIDPRSGVLFANVNGAAYEIRLVPRNGFPTTGSWISKRVPPLLWGAATLLFFILVLRRRSHKVGVIGASAVVLLIVAGLVIDNLPEYILSGGGHSKSRAKLLNSPDAIGEISAQEGAPYKIFRRVLDDADGRPCTPTPWGSTVAYDLRSGKELWRKPLGSLLPAGQPLSGTGNFGAPIVTASGLVITAGSRDPIIQAYNAADGGLLWTGKLPVPAQSTPMTYTAGGRQFVVVDAGGHGGIGTPLGDSVVAFALPQRP